MYRGTTVAEVEHWGVERVADLTALCDRALPSEHLLADDLLACWDGSTAVLADPDGGGAVAVQLDESSGSPTGWIVLVAVVPERRRQGLGGALLAAAESWAFERGAEAVALGGAAPVRFWPGVEATMSDLRAVAESRRYRLHDQVVTRSLPTAFRARPPEAMEVQRVLGDSAASETVELVGRRRPFDRPVVARAVDEATCFVLRDRAGGRPAGVLWHSVDRVGRVEMLALDDRADPIEVGAALLSEACCDLMVAGIARADLVNPLAVDVGAAYGAGPARRFRIYRKPLP